jgi:hypothetical protein
VTHKPLHFEQMFTAHHQPTSKGVSQIMPAEIANARSNDRLVKPLVPQSIRLGQVGKNAATLTTACVGECLIECHDCLLLQANMSPTSMLTARNPNNATLRVNLRPLQLALLAETHSSVQRDDKLRQMLKPFGIGVNDSTQSCLFLCREPPKATTRLHAVLQEPCRVARDLTSLNPQTKSKREQCTISVIRGTRPLVLVSKVLEELVVFSVVDRGRGLVATLSH